MVSKVNNPAGKSANPITRVRGLKPNKWHRLSRIFDVGYRISSNSTLLWYSLRDTQAIYLQDWNSVYDDLIKRSQSLVTIGCNMIVPASAGYEHNVDGAAGFKCTIHKRLWDDAYIITQPNARGQSYNPFCDRNVKNRVWESVGI